MLFFCFCQFNVRESPLCQIVSMEPKTNFQRQSIEGWVLHPLHVTTPVFLWITQSPLALPQLQHPIAKITSPQLYHVSSLRLDFFFPLTLRLPFAPSQPSLLTVIYAGPPSFSSIFLINPHPCSWSSIVSFDGPFMSLKGAVEGLCGQCL